MSTATRGFASMSKEKRSACGRIGALAAHKCGRAYRWNKKTASEAGRRGGVASGKSKRAKRERDEPHLDVDVPERWRRVLGKPVAAPAPPAPAPTPAPEPPPDPMALFAQRLKKVVSDALKDY